MFQQPVTYPVPYQTQVPVPRSIQPFREPETDRRVAQWRNQSSIRTNLLQVFEEEKREQKKYHHRPEYQHPKTVEVSNQIEIEINLIQLEGNKRKEIKYADCSSRNVSRPLIPQIERIENRNRFGEDCSRTRKLLLQYEQKMKMLDLKTQQQLQILQLRNQSEIEAINFDFEEKIRRINNG